jgi:hypothetical protein
LLQIKVPKTKPKEQSGSQFKQKLFLNNPQDDSLDIAELP